MGEETAVSQDPGASQAGAAPELSLAVSSHSPFNASAEQMRFLLRPHWRHKKASWSSSITRPAFQPCLLALLDALSPNTGLSL